MLIAARFESLCRSPMRWAAAWLAICLILATANQAAYGSLTAIVTSAATSSGAPSEQEEKPLEEADPSSPCAKLAGDGKRTRRPDGSLLWDKCFARKLVAQLQNRRQRRTDFRALLGGPLFSPAGHGAGLPLVC